MSYNNYQRLPCYADGGRHRGLHAMYSTRPRPCDCSNDRVVALTSLRLSWPRFWQIVSSELGRHTYSERTTALYRSVMRAFYRHARRPPAAVDASVVEGYIDSLVDKKYSWSWISVNISVLRSVFDKLGGKNVTGRLVTPKRPRSLPEILSRGEARAILAAAPTTRDQLLLGLMYGCGLKVGEVCRLKWAEVDTGREELRVRYARGTRERTLPIPPDLLPVLRMGVERCLPDDYVFQGRKEGSHLGTRMAELIVRKAAKASATLKTVTSMNLRHSFAVHCIEDGCSIRAVQEALGHASIDTTLLYKDCIIPPEVTSPVDVLVRRARRKHGAGGPRRHTGSGGVSRHSPAAKTDPGSVHPASCHPDVSVPTAHSPVAAALRAASPPIPDRKLFDQPLSLKTLDLPFRCNLANSLAAQFHRLLKTCIAGRFLCTRRATARGS